MKAAHGLALVTAAILGLPTSEVGAEPQVKATFKTKLENGVGGQYLPKNIVAAWIVDGQGQFVKTIGRWASVRMEYLVAWRNAAGPADADAVSGATRLDHNDTLTVTWDCKDKLGVLVPDGAYRLRLEYADDESVVQGQNYQGVFEFIKGPDPQNQPGLVQPGYSDVTVDFNPRANECGNGIQDTGEICDGAGCPTSCADSGNACMVNTLAGSAATCNSQCSLVAVTACLDGDGCCADGCTANNDNDCGGDGNISSGCSTGGDTGGAIAFGLLGLGWIISRRKR